MEKELYILTKEDKKILNKILKETKVTTRKPVNYKQKIKRTESVLSTNIVNDIMNNLPQYREKTLEEQTKIFQILQLYYYQASSPKEKENYLQNFCQQCPWLLHKLSSNITDEEKNQIFNKALLIAAETRQYFISENIRLVMLVAKQFQGKGLPYQDLIQEGTLGLIRSVDKFDISKQTRFSTYAKPWIESVIRREIENKSRTIRLPNRVFKKVQKLNFQEANLTFKLNKLPTSEELAQELQIPISQVEELKIIREDATSLDEPISSELDFDYEDVVKDEQATNEFTQVEDNIINNQIKGIIENSGLDEQEKHILFSYYGFNENPKAVNAISKEIGISRYKVEQLKNEAITQLSQKQELAEIASACGILTKRI